MSKQKYVLDFVNSGKPFELPNWTVERHESAMARLVKDYKDADASKQDRLLRNYIIYEALLAVDESVKLDDIQKMHPENLIELFNAVYLEGKKDIFFHEKPSAKKQ